MRPLLGSATDPRNGPEILRGPTLGIPVSVVVGEGHRKPNSRRGGLTLISCRVRWWQ
jgi:hypothetical protein